MFRDNEKKVTYVTTYEREQRRKNGGLNDKSKEELEKERVE